MREALILLLFFLGSLFLAGRLPSARLVGRWLLIPLCFFAAVILSSYVLSPVNQLGNLNGWMLAGGAYAVASGVFTLLKPGEHWGLAAYRRDWSRMATSISGLKKLGLRERFALISAAATLVLAALLNLAFIIWAAPHIWDNLVTRLPRVAYWLQQGNFCFYDANMYTQVLSQKNFEILLLFTYLVSGFRENLVGLAQYVSFWTALLAIYGICRELGRPRGSSLFAALVFGLLPQILLQSVTANSDLFLTALMGTAVYFLLSFSRSGRTVNLMVAAAALGLAAGAKASVVLAGPSLMIVVIYALLLRPFEHARSRLAALAAFLGYTVIALFLFALPAGYWENQEVFGHPFGDEAFRKINSIEGKGVNTVMRQGVAHLSASTLDFLSLDGFLPVWPIPELQTAIQFPLRTVIEWSGIPVESHPGDNWFYDKPWYFNKPPINHPDYCFWGILGFALIWPAVIILSARSGKNAGGGCFSLAAIVGLLVYSFSGASWGHYIIYAAIFAVPAVSFFFPAARRGWKFYQMTVVLLGCLAVIMAVLFQYRSPMVFDGACFLEDRLDSRWSELMPLPARTDSIFGRDRLGQMLRDTTLYDVPFRKFEELVPAGATVAICLNPHSYEFPFFGEGLTRRVIPINSFHRGLQPVPSEADYLVWANDFDEVFNRRPGDVFLGKDWYLRKLR